MRIGIVFFPSSGSDKAEKTARELSRTVESLGHSCAFFNADLESSTKLTSYDYVVVVAKPVSTFGGKISDKVGQFLQSAGAVSGKRSCALILKSGLSSPKALSRLMKTMEKEGMFVNYSDVIATPEEAAETGKRLPLSRD
jgi:hypothetical protein